MATLAESGHGVDNLQRTASNDEGFERQHGETSRGSPEVDGATDLSRFFANAMVASFISQAVGMILRLERIIALS